MKKLVALAAASLCFTGFLSARPQVKYAVDVAGLTLSGKDLSRSGYRWADKESLKNIPLIPLAMPVFTAQVSKQKDRNQRNLISTDYSAKSIFQVLGVGLNGEYSLSLTPLLTFSAEAGIESAWNFSSSNPMVGIYNYEKQEYDKKTSLSRACYNFGGNAKVIIPLPDMFMIQAQYGSKYYGLTGAENKEVWICGSRGNYVNGWQYNASAMLARRFQCEKLKMAGISAAASGWYSDKYFDDRYKNYNPDFLDISIVPMAQFMLKKNQSLMVQAVVQRCRSYRDNDYKSRKEILQEYDKAVWEFKTVMAIWHISLN